jgi:DNA helicase-2/ATP-dependent DNA helicase PcrA
MELSIEQQLAAYANERRVLVCAGAGAGKTRCLTERVRYLIEEKKVDPSKLYCITYTNMAAEEMKLRLGDIIDKCFWNYSNIGMFESYPLEKIIRISDQVLKNKQKFNYALNHVKTNRDFAINIIYLK